MHNGSNSLKTAALLGLLSAILIVGGRWLAGEQGIYYGLTIAVVMNFASYFFSDKIALAMSGAQPLTQETAPEVYARIAPLVENIARRMNIPDAEALHHARTVAATPSPPGETRITHPSPSRREFCNSWTILSSKV